MRRTRVVQRFSADKRILDLIIGRESADRPQVATDTNRGERKDGKGTGLDVPCYRNRNEIHVRVYTEMALSPVLTDYRNEKSAGRDANTAPWLY